MFLRSGIISLSLVLVASPLSAFAGAWPSNSGEGQIISTTLFDNASSGYGDTGKADVDVQFNKIDEAIYWEHGLTKVTTLVMQTSYQDIQFRAGVDDISFSGFGESYAGLRQVFWRDEKWVVSGQVGALFAGAGEVIADADLGSGSTHFEARVLVGRSFKFAKRDGFFDIQTAYRLRPQAQPDEWRADLTAGLQVNNRFQLITQGFYTASNAEFEVARRNSRLKLQGSVVYKHNPTTSYQIGLYQTVAGRNIIKEKAFFISAWKRY